MKLIRKIIINKNNGQASLTLPKKILEELREELRIDKYPKKISFEILNAGKIKNG